MSLYNSNVGALYQITDTKPDKLHSILPSALHLLGDMSGKRITDLGAGTGFFSHHIATELHPETIFAIDNSVLKISLASSKQHPNVLPILADFFFHNLPQTDAVFAAFVLNYAEDIAQLQSLFFRIKNSLDKNGVFVGVIDLPSGQDLSYFGAKKELSKPVDGATMFIRLYDQNGREACVLEANYFKKRTVESLLKRVGFNTVTWVNPIVSSTGKLAFPNMNWETYCQNPELGYFIAQ